MTDPDADLVRSAQAGDRKAFGTLAERYYEMVHVVAFGVLHDRELARDVAQEIFLKVFRELKNFKGDSKFKTWLYRVTINGAIDESRKKRPAQSLDATDVSSDDDKPPVIIVDDKPGPRDETYKGELRVLIKKALDQLSPDHRTILVMREWEQLSYEEIAATLGIELGTVMSRLHYARKKLGEILGPRLKEFA